jgi:hypothetical protein
LQHLDPGCGNVFAMPYRTHRGASEAPSSGDGDLLPIGLVFWIASVAIVAHHILEHEPLTGEAELAMCCVFLVPLLAIRSIKKV